MQGMTTRCEKFGFSFCFFFLNDRERCGGVRWKTRASLYCGLSFSCHKTVSEFELKIKIYCREYISLGRFNKAGGGDNGGV